MTFGKLNTAVALFNQFPEGTQRASVAIDKLNTAPAVKCLYKKIITVDNLELGLQRTKAGVSAGLDGEIKANYLNSYKLEKLSIKLKQHKYKPSPTKKV
jgi:hypothetical protein